MTTPALRHRHTLANGLRVVIEEDHDTPAVAVNLWYGVGSRHERPGRTGLAHLFEHLMFQGSANVAAGEHFALLDAIGAQLNATTSHDRTNYFETVPTQGLDLALWLEADRLGGLLAALDQTGLDNQRDVVRNERRQRMDNQPYGTAWERLFSATFDPGHQYHHMPIGSMQDLADATLDDVRDFFRGHYVPGNAVLSLVGDVDTEEALAKVERYFGGIDAGVLPPIKPPQPAHRRTPQRIDVTDEDVPNSAVFLMWPVPADGSESCDHLDLAAQILTEANSSRLKQELVRRQRAATSVYGGLNRMVGGRSVFTVMAMGADGVEPQHLLDLVNETVQRLGQETPGEQELESARANCEAGYLQATQDLAGRADSLSHGACLFGDPGYDETTLEAIRACDADDVRRTVSDWLDPAEATVLTYRPREDAAR
ncbi:M16 family metallopeptidase [Sphaerisporangium fuscum]|uniref:M16 family metallopeptidase n=1 Tax=Sphaerisporangium fuscum TaxID=2835868 RepID=UPI001BDDC65D|nr:pitrilysin family protein [Sphaerisporangium fuscum]